MVFDSELCGVHIVNLPSMDYKLCDQVSDTVKNKNNLKKIIYLKSCHYKTQLSFLHSLVLSGPVSVSVCLTRTVTTSEVCYCNPDSCFQVIVG